MDSLWCPDNPFNFVTPLLLKTGVAEMRIARTHDHCAIPKLNDYFLLPSEVNNKSDDDDV
jgi:hypothetical protein